MAKKKNEDTLQYLQMPLPSGRKYSKMTKVAFGGLNKRYTLDSGDLSMERDISTNEYPYLTPSNKKNEILKGYSNPISMFAFDDFILIVYRQNSAIKIDYVNADNVVYTGVLKSEGATEADDVPRSIVQFNVYNQSLDIVNGTYDKKLLIFPDKMSMDFKIEGDFTPAKMPDSMTPNIKYATVHLSRVFGVSDDSVYASGFNDYTNWNLDTIDEYNESNAWMSKTQSNTKADGKFTGIINFQGHIVCFKRDYMHEIYNTKNPFRIQDIYAEGAIDNRTIQDVDGKLIFVSEDDVKVYTGSNPRIIGYNLNMSQFTYAVSGTDNRNYYLYCEDANNNTYLYVYDTFTDLWSEQYADSKVISFAHNKNGMYMLCADGSVYKMDTDSYSDDWCFETDLITNKTVNIKHIKKLQMLAEVEGKLGYSYIDYGSIDSLDDLEVEYAIKIIPDGVPTNNGTVCGTFKPEKSYVEVDPISYADFGTVEMPVKKVTLEKGYYAIDTGLYGGFYEPGVRLPKYDFDLYCVPYGNVIRVDEETEITKAFIFQHSDSDYDGSKGDVVCTIYKIRDEFVNESSFNSNYGTYDWVRQHGIPHNKVAYKVLGTGMYYGWNETEWKALGYNQSDLDVMDNANFDVYILYDDEKFNKNTSHLVYSSKKSGKFPVRVKPRNTANYGFKLHIEGSGYVKLYELEIFVESGGELYV